MLFFILILVAVAIFGGGKAVLKTLLWGPVVICLLVVFIGLPQESKIGILIISACLALAFCFDMVRKKQKEEKEDTDTYLKKIEIEQYRKEHELREFERESHIRAREACSKR